MRILDDLLTLVQQLRKRWKFLVPFFVGGVSLPRTSCAVVMLLLCYEKCRSLFWVVSSKLKGMLTKYWKCAVQAGSLMVKVWQFMTIVQKHIAFCDIQNSCIIGKSSNFVKILHQNSTYCQIIQCTIANRFLHFMVHQRVPNQVTHGSQKSCQATIPNFPGYINQ